MMQQNDNHQRRTIDDNGFGLGLSIIAAVAIVLVLGLVFWTLNTDVWSTALNTNPKSGITTGIAPDRR